MKFDDLDIQMRRFEKSLDQTVPDSAFIVARLDGRGFTKLTKAQMDFEPPFDERFHALMMQTTQQLMDCGFDISYAYTQSDEISLLFAPGCQTFNRKVRKINSLLAGQASAVFSLALGRPAVFDCRLCPLPAVTDVIDYFRWRSADAFRNALSAHCYWLLRKQGHSGEAADAMMSGISQTEKIGYLLDHGIDFGALPQWQREGSGLLWEPYEIEGRNPVTGELVKANRRKVVRLEKTPTDSDIDALVVKLCGG
jgi:tRNA(His) guanylyltransferase